MQAIIFKLRKRAHGGGAIRNDTGQLFTERFAGKPK
jgi:hypothetical protein